MANWDENTKKAVWNKCKTIDGKSKDEYRLDEQGAMIQWKAYGDYTNGGWQIDHIYPESVLQDLGIEQEKIDNEINLRAANSYNNDTKSNDYPNFKSSRVYDSQKGKNVDKEGSWQVTKEKQAQLKKFFRLK